MFANEEKETMGREEMKALQLSRLKKQIKWACSKSSFYQKKFTEAGIGVPQIDSLDDLEKLDNWGVAVRDSELCLMVLDVGFSKSVAQLHY